MPPSIMRLEYMQMWIKLNLFGKNILYIYHAQCYNIKWISQMTKKQKISKTWNLTVNKLKF